MANPIISVIIRARDHASDLIRRIRDQLNDLPNPTIDLNLNGAGEAASSLAGIAKGALIAAVGIGSVTEALGAAKHAFIDYNAELEQTRVAFTSMLYSAEAADKMLADLQKFAAETPFEMPGVRTAAQQLIAFGYEADEILPTLTALGNAASGLGKGEVGFGQLAFVFGQIRTTGKLMGNDVMQLAQLGVPVKDILAKNLGLAKDELANIGELGIDADVAIQALIDGMNERFPDMMKKQSETFEGIMSNIKDNLGQAFGGIGLGIFEEAKKGLLEVKEITDTFLANVQQHKNVFDDILPRDLAQKLTALWNELQNILSEFKPLIEPLGEALGALFELSIDKARLLYVGLKPIVAVLVEIASLALEAAAAFAKFVDFGYEKILSLGDATSETTDAMYSAFGDTWQSIKQDTADFCLAALEYIVGLAAAIGEAIVSIVNAFESVFHEIAETVRDYMEAAAGYVQGFIDWVNSAIGSLRELIGWADSAVSALQRLSGAQASVALTGDGSLLGQIGSWFDGIRTKGKVTLSSHGFGGGSASKNPDGDIIVPTATTPSVKQEREGVSFHGGGSGGGGGGRSGKSDADREAERAAKEAEREAKRLAEHIEKLTEKIQQHVKSVAHDIVTEVGTVYENGMESLTKKLEGMRADIAEAASLGIDTKELEADLSRYEDLVKEKVTRAWREANEDIANDTVLTWAQVNKNVREEAEITYRIGVLRVEREKENKLKEVALTKDSAEARVAVERWAAAEIAKLEQARLESLCKSPRTTLEAWQATLEEQYERLRDTGAQMKDLTDSIYTSMADGFTTGFQDVLTDGFDGIARAFSDMLRNMLNAIVKFLMNQMITRWLSSILPGFGGGAAASPAVGLTGSYGTGFHFDLPGLRATGGPVAMGKAYLIGERGPEIFRPQQPGRVLNSLPTGSAPNIKVIVNNNTGEKMTARTESKLDGKEYITSVFVEAVSTNKGGIRDVIKGVR